MAFTAYFPIRNARRLSTLTFIAALFLFATWRCPVVWADQSPSADPPQFYNWASTPPMGWNSWDCFGAAVTEEQTKANADYMAAHLKSHGWRYIVVDIQWYEPMAQGWDYRPNANLNMDEYGRLLPATNRFSSAADGNGFKSLAEYVHTRGLEFGIHMLRGIPRQAVNRNTPIYGTTLRARDIVDESSTCAWNGDMWGVDTTKPGAKEYYDALFRQYAAWGIDFIKVDDLSRPYHTGEIEAIRHAIDHCGRPIVFSTSPGATPLADAAHIAAHANMWRISDDFWDRWEPLKEQFKRCADSAPLLRPRPLPRCRHAAVRRHPCIAKRPHPVHAR